MTKKASALVQGLGELYPQARAELNFDNEYELLIAVILSAQCTDIRVNIITEELFKVAPSAQAMVDLGEEGIKELIRTCGMFNQKAKNIYRTSQILVEDYDGKIQIGRAHV